MPLSMMVPLSMPPAHQKKRNVLIPAITLAYSKQDSVPSDEQGHVFGLPLSHCIILPQSTPEAWLAM